MGQARLLEFITGRLQNNKIDFMDPLTKQIKFGKMNKRMKIKANEKVKSVNIDRRILSKRAIIAQIRGTDVHNPLNICLHLNHIFCLTLMIACD